MTFVERFLGRLALNTFAHPVRASILILALTAGSFYAATFIKVDADLIELMPKSFQSVQDIEHLKKRFGGVGYVVVMGMNGTREQLTQFADDVVPKLEALPSVRYVDYQRPVAYFEDRALYFLELDDLKTVEERISSRMDYERQKRNPLYLDLEEKEPPELDFSDIQKNYEGRSDRTFLEAQMGEKYYIDEKTGMICLLVKPASMSSDLGFTKVVVSEVRDLLDSMDLSQYGGDFRIGYSGRYTKKIAQQKLLENDLRYATSIAILLVLLYLGFHFRRILAIFLIFVPLLIGLIWTHGYAAMVFGTLNILTAFIGAILLGLGIDHGIHLLSRFEHELAEGRELAEAIGNTFSETGRAVIVAGITTTVGFAGLSISEFRAFGEFGAIASIGMILMVISYTLCLPAMLGLAAKTGWRPSGKKHSEAVAFAQQITGKAKVIVPLSIILVAVMLTQISNTKFNYDLGALEPDHLEAYVLDKKANKLLGYSQTPVIILTDSLEKERIAGKALRERQESFGDKTSVDFFASSADLIPVQQEEKYEVLQELRKSIRKIKSKWLDKEHREHFKSLKRMLKIKPYTREDMPEQVRRQFHGSDGSKDDGFVLIFPSISLADGERVVSFAKEVRNVPLPDGTTVSAAGEAMLLADIINMITREAPPVLTLTLVLIFLTLSILVGNLFATFLCLTPALGSLLVTLGLMPWLNIELNYLNIIMVPVLFGVGIDGGVHLVTRFQTSTSMAETLAEIGRAISGSILTSGLGFGALVLANHPGLNSLGKFALLGLAVNLIFCLIVIPAILSLRRGPKSEAATTS